MFGRRFVYEHKTRHLVAKRKHAEPARKTETGLRRTSEPVLPVPEIKEKKMEAWENPTAIFVQFLKDSLRVEGLIQTSQFAGQFEESKVPRCESGFPMSFAIRTVSLDQQTAREILKNPTFSASAPFSKHCAQTILHAPAHWQVRQNFAMNVFFLQYYYYSTKETVCLISIQAGK